MCSTARVVSSPSCSGPTLHADDPRLGPAHDEENLVSPRPNTRTPQEALASDLDWDEDELGISAYPSLQQIVHTDNENDDEVQARIHTHMPVDERTPLLPSMTDEAPRPTSPHHPQDSMPIKSTTVGQSTFHQTVSHRVFSFLPSIAFSAFDASTSFSMPPHYCLVLACFRSLLRSPMQGGSVEHYSLSPMATSRATRMFLVPHIAAAAASTNQLPFKGQNIWRASWSLIQVCALIQTLVQRRLVCVPCLS